MAEKQKKIVIDTAHGGKRSVVLPEGAFVQFVGSYIVAYINTWDRASPIFQFKCEEVDPPMISIVDISEDEEIIEKVKKLSKDEMNTLRNIMDSTGLL